MVPGLGTTRNNSPCDDARGLRLEPILVPLNEISSGTALSSLARMEISFSCNARTPEQKYQYSAQIWETWGTETLRAAVSFFCRKEESALPPRSLNIRKIKMMGKNVILHEKPGCPQSGKT